MIFAKIFAVIKKDLFIAVRYGNGLAFWLISPGAQLASFYYLSRAVGVQFRPEGMPYFLFLVVGTSLYAFLFAGIHSFVRVVQESQQNGMVEVLMTTSTPPTVLVVLSAISAFGAGILQFVIYLSVGIVLSSAAHVNVFGCLTVFMLSALMAVATGLFAAGLQIAIHKGSAVLWVIGSSAWVLTGTMFPIAALPRPVRLISTLLPFTHSLTGMRLAIQQGSLTPALTHEIELLIAFTIVLLPLSITFFSWTVRRARQLGTLSFY